MKLVTYRRGNEAARSGILSGSDLESAKIMDLVRATAWVARAQGGAHDEHTAARQYGATVLAFVERAAEARPVAEAALAALQDGRLPQHSESGPMWLDRRDVTLLAPIPRPPSMRDGYAFRQHVATARKNRGLDMIAEFDEFPVFYFTNHQAVIGPGELRVRPRQLERLDFELEAAIVIGREAHDLDAAEADAVVFGLTIMNDYSARALQMEEMKLSLGPAKGKDFATALGPYLVTLDELAGRTERTPRGNVYDLEMRAFVNGVRVSTGNVKDMTWTFAQILERASYGVTLYPGDVIGSGTCGTGCFLELNGSKITNDQWLRPGDRVALEIDGLGRLENEIVAIA